MKGKYLITTDNWFYAPDGQLYQAAWGEVEVVKDSILGIKTNRNATNWFLKVGCNDKEILIAGCQVHYAIKHSKPPLENQYKREIEHNGCITIQEVSSRIYIAE